MTGGLLLGKLSAVVVLTVVNQGHVSQRAVLRAERAVQAQVGQARAYWPMRELRFGPDGLPVYLEADPAVVAADCGPDAIGCHGSDSLVVGTTDRPWSLAFSHEVLEELAVEGGGPATPEICDPVEGQYFAYRIGHVLVSDFALPAYFRQPRPRRGPLDYRHRLRAFLRWWASS